MKLRNFLKTCIAAAPALLSRNQPRKSNPGLHGKFISPIPIPTPDSADHEYINKLLDQVQKALMEFEPVEGHKNFFVVKSKANFEKKTLGIPEGQIALSIGHVHWEEGGDLSVQNFERIS